MIKATVNKGNVECSIEGRGIQILAELSVLADAILGMLVDEDEDEDEEVKRTIVEEFCGGLKFANLIKTKKEN